MNTLSFSKDEPDGNPVAGFAGIDDAEHGNERDEELDLTALNSFCSLQSPGDDSFLRELVELYVSEACARISAIKIAVTAKDDEGLKRAAHALKGSSATLGLAQIAQICESLERLTHAEHPHRADVLIQLLQYKFGRARAQLDRSLQTEAN